MPWLARIRDNLTAFQRRRRAPSVGQGLRAAAVAIVVCDEGVAGEPMFLLTRRASTLRRHAGQYALPGGRVDPGETREQTALRELREELGVTLDAGAVLGRLDDFPTRSGFSITPVVMWGGTALDIDPDPAEVAEVFRVPISDLTGPGVPHIARAPDSDRPLISLPLVNTRVFAPTAAILHQFHEVCVMGRPTRVDHFEQPAFARR